MVLLTTQALMSNKSQCNTKALALLMPYWPMSNICIFYSILNNLFKCLSGREFFVGISETSNEAGASAVAEAFPEFPCTPIKVPINFVTCAFVALILYL